jgi:outer membrane protein
VIMNAEVAYFGLIQAIQVQAANEEAVQQTSQHLTEAKAFYSAGRVAQLDVTTAEVNLANANVNLIHARNQVRIAKLQLENAMGVYPTREYTVRQTFDTIQFDLSIDSVRAIAFNRRPEYVSAQSRLEANKSLLTAAWDMHLPTISATGGYTWSNFEISPLFNRWTAGLTVSLPIFQGFAINGQVEQAQANVEAAQANLNVLSESIKLEVEQNYLSLREAADRISATDKLVDRAEEALNLAVKQYTAGVGTQLEVTDAQLAVTNARITRIQALHDYSTSRVQLLRSMGILGE